MHSTHCCRATAKWIGNMSDYKNVIQNTQSGDNIRTFSFFTHLDVVVFLPHTYITWASYQIRKIAGCACAGNAGNVFPRRRFQRKQLVSDPDMHHGPCVTHVPWCMSGSLACGNGENAPGIPGACAPGILRIWQEAHCVWYTCYFFQYNGVMSDLSECRRLLLLLLSARLYGSGHKGVAVLLPGFIIKW